MRVLRFLFRRLGRLYLAARCSARCSRRTSSCSPAPRCSRSGSTCRAREFGRIVAVSQGLTLLESVVTFIYSWGRLKPARSWLAGDDERRTRTRGAR